MGGGGGAHLAGPCRNEVGGSVGERHALKHSLTVAASSRGNACLL